MRMFRKVLIELLKPTTNYMTETLTQYFVYNVIKSTTYCVTPLPDYLWFYHKMLVKARLRRGRIEF